MDSQYDDRLIFSFTKDGESLWRGDAVLNQAGYQLSVVKQLEVPVGKAVTLKTEGISTDENSVSFVTRSNGKKFQTLTVQIPNGEILLNADEYIYTRMSEKRVNFRQNISAIKANNFLLDNIPQGEGILNWVISWETANKPKEITVSLTETFDIPYVKKGEELGALMVCNVPYFLMLQ